MKVLIQDGRSKRYFVDAGEWAEDVREGRNFGTHRRAYEAARQTSVSEFNIILYSPRIKNPLAVDHGWN